LDTKVDEIINERIRLKAMYRKMFFNNEQEEQIKNNKIKHVEMINSQIR